MSGGAKQPGWELRKAVIKPLAVERLNRLFDELKAQLDASFAAGFYLDRFAQTRIPNGTYGFEAALRSPELFKLAQQALRDLLGPAGLARAAAERLGDAFSLSLSMSMFRHREPDKDELFLDWHQDSKIYGPEVSSMNVWIPLSPCGDAEAPGLDLVDGFDDTLAPGQSYDNHSKSLTDGYADFVASLNPNRIHSPRFETGDLLLFNAFTLHRTTPGKTFTKARRSLEMRFFNQVPKAHLMGVNLSNDDLKRAGVIA